jgi:hypothetical protein
MRDDRETGFNRIEGDIYAYYFSSERKWINRFKKDAEKYPDEVLITHINDDGSICIRYPYDWVPYPRPKRQRAKMSDEQRQAAAERFAKARELKTTVNDNKS